MIYDLHSHILPAMDDGAKDTATSQAMLEMAFRQGTVGMVATPHIIATKDFALWPGIVASCKMLSETAQRRGWNISVYPGAEVAVSAELLSVLKTPGAFCINGTGYLLLELPAHHIPHYIDELLFTLQVRGFEIVLAHPERHAELIRKPDILWKWLDKGILMQINGTSLMGLMGPKAMRFAETLVEQGAVYCLGSDAHGVGRRNPDLKEAAEKLASLAGPEKAREILVEHPARMLAGKANQEYDFKALPETRTFWQAPRFLLGSLF
jgi:protein-tyrosine phosphatase